MIYSQYDVASQAPGSPCYAHRWEQGAHWTGEGCGINDNNNAPDPLGVVHCGNSADTESGVVENTTYDPSVFAIVPTMCVDPNTTLPVTVNAPFTGQRISWFNFDVRPYAGIYDFQTIATGNYELEWALYYSLQDTCGTGTNGLSGNCAVLSGVIGCGTDFNGWSPQPYLTPIFDLPTNLYLVVWKKGATDSLNDDFNFTFKARYGCGDFCSLLFEGDPIVTCNPDGSYQVVQQLNGTSSTVTFTAPGSTSIITDPTPLTFTTADAIPNINTGTVTVTYPAGVNYNITYTPSGEGLFCLPLNRSGTAPNCCITPICSIDGPDLVCPGASVAHCGPMGASGYSWAISGDGIISGATNGQCVTVTASGSCNASYTVTLTVGSGSCTSICTDTVTINDVIAPVIICPPVVSPIYCPAIPVFPLAIATDACDTSVALTFSDQTNPGLWPQEFSVTRTWTATDDCGNTATCSSTINILDSTAPVLTCPTVISPIECGSVVSFGIATATDACDPDVDVTFTDITVQGACPQSYSVTRTWTAMDNTMNSSTCSRTIVVQDNTLPVIICPVVVSPIACGAIPLFGTATASDACDTTVDISFSDVTIPGLCPQEYTVTRTWIATDDCDNTASCSATIVVGGNTQLIISCPPDSAIACATAVPAIDITLIEYSGNCGTVTVTHLNDVISNQTCLNNFILIRTYQAIDACGEAATCSQTFSVLDTTPPAITFPEQLPQQSGDTLLTQCYGQDPEWDIPAFDAGSILVTDNCAEDVIITYDISLEDEGDCRADGYINLYKLAWTATDVCGNSSSAHLYLALVDTIAPVIEGVPDNITVNCENIPEPPSVFATDECLCACVVYFQETSLDPSACQDGLVIIRTWTARDRCGNETIDTQRITLVDQSGPIVSITHPELTEYSNGSVIEYTCTEGGIPAFFDLMDTNAVSGQGVCDSNSIITFTESNTIQTNCDYFGYLEQREFKWTATDPCGNATDLTITVRLIDNEAPVISGLPEMVCIGDPLLNDIEVSDNCDHVSLRYWDVNIPNPCGEGTAQRRTYEAYDGCGNVAVDTVILLPLTQNEPLMIFVDPEMALLDSSLVMHMNCEAIGGRYTTFSIDDVRVEGICAAGATIEFTETILSTKDCIPGGSMATVELRWTATDVCGAFAERIIIAEIIDESGPEFVNFKPVLSIGCADKVPEILATDNCGEVFITYADTILQGPCAYEYDLLRLITATDLCGNVTIRKQTIHVGNEAGPVISGVEVYVCDDLSIPKVTAYDACADQFVAVTMVQDTLESVCRDGLVILRKWSATDACGHITSVQQTIVMNDLTPPEILIPSYSVIQHFMEQQYSTVYHSQISLLAKLNAIDADHVYVSDDCDQQIIPVFTVDTLFAEDCLTEGYAERRTYTWIATDICDNSDTLSFTIDIIDDMVPDFMEVIYDTLIICAPLPPATSMLMMDSTENVTIVFTETQETGPGEGQITVIRTWVATDSCRNSATYVQQIIWHQEATLECTIIFPEVVDCNSHGVVIGSEILGGVGPYTYEWEVVGEKCFIQGGQGTPEILIYVGWADVKIILTVTDTFGCVSMCMVSLECRDNSTLPLSNTIEDTNRGTAEGQKVFQAPLNSNREHNDDRLSFWPNPADEVIHIAYESDTDGFVNFLFTDYLGKVIQKESMMVHKGYNVKQMDASGLANGSYLIQIKSEKAHYTRGVIILHLE